VLDLPEVEVGIAVVHERVHVLERLPHRHAPLVECLVLALLRAHEVERLVGVVQPVQLVDGRAGAFAVVAETLLLRGRAHHFTLA